MTAYQVDDIVRDVRVAIDENYSETHPSIQQDVDTLALQDIVKDKIEDAARAVILVAPQEMLGEGESFTDSAVTWETGRTGDGVGSLAIPGDFLRLVSFKMSDWHYPITGYVTEDDAEYRILRSRFAGLSGCPERPAVALVHYGDEMRLEFFSCTGGSSVTVQRAQYMPIPAIYTESGVDKIDISQRLYKPTVYYTAHLVATAIGNNEMAQAMMATCKELLAIE